MNITIHCSRFSNFWICWNIFVWMYVSSIDVMFLRIENLSAGRILSKMTVTCVKCTIVGHVLYWWHSTTLVYIADWWKYTGGEMSWMTRSWLQRSSGTSHFPSNHSCNAVWVSTVGQRSSSRCFCGCLLFFPAPAFTDTVPIAQLAGNHGHR